MEITLHPVKNLTINESAETFLTKIIMQVVFKPQTNSVTAVALICLPGPMAVLSDQVLKLPQIQRQIAINSRPLERLQPPLEHT